MRGVYPPFSKMGSSGSSNPVQWRSCVVDIPCFPAVLLELIDTYANVPRGLLVITETSGAVRAFDLRHKTWHQLPARPPWAGRNTAMIAQNGTVYLIGESWIGSAHGRIASLDLRGCGRRWVSWPRFARDVVLWAAIAWGETLYVFGGYLKVEVHCVDLKTQIWRRCQPSLRYPVRLRNCAVCIGDVAFVLTRISGWHTRWVVQCYDLPTESCTVWELPLVPEHHAASHHSVACQRLLVIHGQLHVLATVTRLEMDIGAYVLTGDPRTRVWTTTRVGTRFSSCPAALMGQYEEQLWFLHDGETDPSATTWAEFCRPQRGWWDRTWTKKTPSAVVETSVLV